MTDLPKLENKLINVIQNQVLGGADPIDTDTPLFDIGLDSMAIMQLMLLIESECDVMLPAEDLTRENFATVHVLAGVVQKRLQEKENVRGQ